MSKDLESVLVSMRAPKISGDSTEIRKGNRTAFANPFLQNISDTSLWEAQPENSALQIIFFNFCVFINAPFLCGSDGFFFKGFDV